MKLIPIIIATIFLSCCGSHWVNTSRLDWIEQVYKIDHDCICRIDTVDDGYGGHYIVYYKSANCRKDTIK